MHDLTCSEIPNSWNNEEKTKMANFNEGDSRHELNYPEFPYSWNNGER